MFGVKQVQEGVGGDPKTTDLSKLVSLLFVEKINQRNNKNKNPNVSLQFCIAKASTAVCKSKAIQ